MTATAEPAVKPEPDEKPDEKPAEKPGQDDPGAEAIELSGDHGFSIAESVVLHLHSEHDVPGALAMDEQTALERHKVEHEKKLPHARGDLSFRPGRILDTLRLDAARQRALDPTKPPIPKPIPQQHNKQ